MYGSAVFEALVRNGVKEFLICDYDIIDVTNINRQLIANTETIGKLKIDVAYEKAIKINPNVQIKRINEKVIKNIEEILTGFNADYIIDAIDDIDAKMQIIKYANKYNIKLISAMGAGNRLEAKRLDIKDISKMTYDKMAKKIRKLLRGENFKKVLVVGSDEDPIKLVDAKIGTICEVPIVSGMLIANQVINEIIKGE